jgi:hypothetical protein
MNKILKDYYDAVAISNEKAGILETQTIRVVGAIAKFFKLGKDYWWAFDYYEGDIMPKPQRVGADGYFPIYISKNCESAKVSYSDCFPVSFFDMTDNEIHKYLQKEAQEDLEKQKIKDEKAALSKKARESAKNSLKESALSKLTKAERKALKL